MCDTKELYILDPYANQLNHPGIQEWMMGQEENGTERSDNDSENEEDSDFCDNQLGDPRVQQLLEEEAEAEAEGAEEEDDEKRKRSAGEREIMNGGEGSKRRKKDLGQVIDRLERFIENQRAMVI
jgi:hypothetical protein